MLNYKEIDTLYRTTYPAKILLRDKYIAFFPGEKVFLVQNYKLLIVEINRSSWGGGYMINSPNGYTILVARERLFAISEVNLMDLIKVQMKYKLRKHFSVKRRPK